MAKKKKRNKTSKRTKKTNNSVIQRLKPYFVGLAVIFFISLFSYIGYLDYTVRSQFEGRRWAVPARVYASPLEVYSGLKVDIDDFEVLLRQMRYRNDSELLTDATYYRKNRGIYLRTRSFRFWDSQEPTRNVKILFSGSSVQALRDATTSEDLPIIRLDPVKIGSFYPTRKEDRILLRLDDVPRFLINALMAAEDRDFYTHHGLSIRGIFRALWANIKAGKFVQGGSTITQQLVKNFYLTPERSLWRKLNEAAMALILEIRYGKDEILEAYFNEVYLGQDRSRAIHGFGLASEFYFDRSLKQLDPEQLAMLVTLVRGASYYNPRRHPERTRARRNRILDGMVNQGYLSSELAYEVKQKSLGVSEQAQRQQKRHFAFLSLVRRQLQEQYRYEDLSSEGLRIFTTLDPLVQRAVEKRSENGLKRLEKKKNVDKLEIAAIVTRREGGEVVALIGGRTRIKGFNRALDALRPIGSLVKPAVYLTALESPENYTLVTPLDDTTITLEGPQGEIWRPRNYDRREHGKVALHTALSQSYNLATVRLGLDVGIGQTVKTLKNLGLKEPIKKYPSLLLGAISLSPFDVTQMYQTLAGDGFSTPLRAIRSVVSQDGEPLQRYPLRVRQVVDSKATFLTNWVLQEAVHEGTGKSVYQYLPQSMNVVGKTGTTNNSRDSWFAGFTGDYLGVIWIGRDDNKSANLTGASGSLQIWGRIMQKISSQPVDLLMPDDVENVWIDTQNGLRTDQQCPSARNFPFVTSSAPVDYSSCVQKKQSIESWFENLFE